jgi:hypothetical protein
MAIEFILSYKGIPVIRLTENVIQSVDFSAVKYDGYHQQTKNIIMRLKFENANVLFREPLADTGISEDGDAMPDEIDSVRNMFSFAVSAVQMATIFGLPFLDGVINITYEFGEIASYSYENLFVISYTEEYTKDTRNTFIDIHLRERAR